MDNELELVNFCILSNILLVSDEPEVKTRIKQWIRLKKEAGELDDLQALEAYRLSVILVSQLKVI